MTKDEWLAIGYSNHVIEDVPVECCVRFSAVYSQWFVMKMHKIKRQSLDRIEVTYNKYYLGSDFESMFVNHIDKKVIAAFINNIVVNYAVTYKELGRIYQIVNNVLVYAHDMEIGYCQLVDWGFVKRSLFVSDVVKPFKNEFIISDSDRQKLFKGVIDDNIYPLKRSACLLLLMNFSLGLRIGELASLRFSDFDLEYKVVRIYKTEVKYFPRDERGVRSGRMIYDVVDNVKTDSSFRVLPLTEECIYLYSLIADYHKSMNYSSKYLCFDGTETIMTRSLERTLSRLCVLLGINHINSHRIRKTYASLLHNNGVPTRVITDLCGHADMETTEKCYILTYEGGYSAYMERINYALNNYIDRGVK